MYDAVKAGFEKIVFVIRRHFEDAFKEKIGSKLDGIAETVYAYQELDNCLDNFTLPADREKPWGTAHAILVAKDLIREPFAVINADDYYGANSFRILKDYLSDPSKINENNYAMVGYTLRNTLSEHGTVSRGTCKTDENDMLIDVVERKGIKKAGNAAAFTDENGDEQFLTGDEITSMNLWGFAPSIFGHLQKQFDEFLHQQGRQQKSEFFIPEVVDRLVKSSTVSVKTLKTDDKWFGVTYREDMPIARDCIKELIEKGKYPENLWKK